MIKWIGQHIWDFVSRFRNDVYLENIADGTVDSDKFLGLDSNNKIVKEAALTTVTDLHSAGVDGAANQLLTDDGDGTITSESTLTYDSEFLNIGAADAGSAGIKRTASPGGTGGALYINGGSASGTNMFGGSMFLEGGESTGTANGGSIYIQGGPPGSSGSSLNSTTAVSRFTFAVGITSPYGATPGSGRGWQQTIDLDSDDFEDVYSAGDAVPGYRLKYAPAGTQSSLGTGEIYYLHTDGSWVQADASATSTGATQLLGVIAVGASLPGKGCYLEGMIRIPAASILNTPGSGTVDGLPVYVSTTAGHFDFTAPSGNNEYVRCVGYALDDHPLTGDVLVWFKPDNTYVKITV